MEIFEDLFSNVLRGTLTILDSQGLARIISFCRKRDINHDILHSGGEGTSFQRNKTSRTIVEDESSTF